MVNNSFVLGRRAREREQRAVALELWIRERDVGMMGKRGGSDGEREIGGRIYVY